MTDFSASQEVSKIVSETQTALDTDIALGTLRIWRRWGRVVNEEVAKAKIVQLLEELNGT